MLINRIKLLLILILYSSYVLAQIKVESGNISYFQVNYKKIVRAGEETTITIIAKDPFDNDVTDFSGKVKVKINNKNEVVTFSGGTGSLKFYSETTGKYDFKIYLENELFKIRDSYTSGFLNKFSIYVLNNKISKVEIITSPEFIPGYEKEFSIVAYDKFGNLVNDTSYGEQSLIIQTNGSFKTIIRNKELENGKKTIKFIPPELHDIKIEVFDENKSLLGSKTLVFVRQVPKDVKIAMPEKTRAGEEFEVKLSVYDQNGLLIKVYDKIGKSIKLTHNGSGKLIPDIIQPQQFSKGIAIVKLIYTKNEQIKITPVIEGYEKISYSEEPKEQVKETPKEEKKQEITKKSETKEKTIPDEIVKAKEPIKILNLFIPKNIGKLENVEILKEESGIKILKLIISNRNKDIEVIKINRNIEAYGRKIGSLSLYENQEGEIEIEVKSIPNYTINPVLDKSQNLIKLEIYKD
jgi:uncharacterized Zn finger protein (UPF0148 family)